MHRVTSIQRQQHQSRVAARVIHSVQSQRTDVSGEERLQIFERCDVIVQPARLREELLRLLTSLRGDQRHDVLLDAPDVQLTQAARVSSFLTQLTLN